MTIDQIIERLKSAKGIVGGDVEITSVSSVTCADDVVRLHLRHFEDMDLVGKECDPPELNGNRWHYSVRVGDCEFYGVGPAIRSGAAK